VDIPDHPDVSETQRLAAACWNHGVGEWERDTCLASAYSTPPEYILLVVGVPEKR